MPPSKAKSPLHATPADTTKAVDDFMAALDHPRKVEIEALRKLILAVDPAIAEGIKWNAPSFRVTEYFATTNLRATAGIGVILHLGAKARDLPPGGIAIADPEGLLRWLGKDRAMVEFADLKTLKAKGEAFRAVLRQWITHV
jgi:hypothetical protein